MAITDPEMSMGMPKTVAVNSSLNALAMAVESIVSIHSNDYTSPYAQKAAVSIISNFKNILNEPLEYWIEIWEVKTLNLVRF